MTENYIIFLKCDVDLRANSPNFTNHSRIVIHMAPTNNLTVRKCHRRTLGILLSNSCSCFFKLLICQGYGAAWVKWRQLENICRENKQCVLPRWALISYEELDTKVQKYLSTEKFLRPIRIELMQPILRLNRSKGHKEPLNSNDHSILQTSDSSVVTRIDSGRKGVTVITWGHGKDKTVGNEIETTEKPKTGEEIEGVEEKEQVKAAPQLSKERKETKCKKTRLVHRFGKGIPEGCAFDLSLSCNDSSSDEEDPILNSNKPTVNKGIKRNSSMVIGPFDYFSAQKMALKHIHCSREFLAAKGKKETEGTQKRRNPDKNENSNQRTKSSDNLSTQKMALNYILHSEKHFAAKDVNERKDTQKIRESATSGKEKSMNRTSNDIYSQKPAAKVINETDEAVHCTLRIASKFHRVSSMLLIPRGIKKSQSVESMIPIGSISYKNGYYATNVSLPNLDELEYYRRNNRLSFAADFKDAETNRSEAGQILPISFWLPDHTQNHCCKCRIYCASPVNRKLQALRMKSDHSRTNTCNLSLFESNQNAESIANDKRSLCESDEIGNSTSSAIVALARKVLEEMDNEYPIRHSLWIKSPSAKDKDLSSEKSTKMREEKTTDQVEELKKEEPCNRVSKRLKNLNPCHLAQELKRIQLQLFCEMENGEIVRYMLKPRSVTEVNCPYLCGYLYFFDHTKNIVITELLAEKNEADMADALCYFIRVAYYCLKLLDKQSTYAILCGLCSPEIIKRQVAWSVIHRCYGDELRIFVDLLHICWKEKNTYCTNSHIPFFKCFLDMLYEVLLQKREFPRPNSGSVKLRDCFTSWLNGKNKRQKTFVNHIVNFLSSTNTHRNIQEKKLQTRNRHHFEELLISCYGQLEEVFNIIEECRQNYCFTIHFVPQDEDTRHVLLSKPYMDVLCN